MLQDGTPRASELTAAASPAQPVGPSRDSNKLKAKASNGTVVTLGTP